MSYNIKDLAKPIPLSEVELRIGGSVVKEGFFILVYKTARVDANRLDDVIGALNWQCKHYVDSKRNVVCSIGIYDQEKKEWIWKEDTGKESNTEAEKGSYSDSFKRAGYRWNIGRELYDMPKIWVNWSDWTDKGKPTCDVKRWSLQKLNNGGYFILDEKKNLVWEEINGSVSSEKPESKPTKPKTKAKEEPTIVDEDTLINDIKEQIANVGQEIVAKRIAGFETAGKIKEFSGKVLKDRNSLQQWESLRDSLKKILNGERL